MIKNNLAQILQERGIKYSQFAKKCEISYSYLRKIIKGNCIPSIAFQNRIANTLGMRVEEIFREEKDE